ncbi:MAG: hypothetical protein ING52_10705 [Burkholderiales bacterium]|jgi:hypothetical protein|nr:hypothetical protein [Burkholderiales bacterium]
MDRPLLEVLADVAYACAHAGYREDDSRSAVNTMIAWAEEFERHWQVGQFDRDDYIGSVDRFVGLKLHEAGQLDAPPLPSIARHLIANAHACLVQCRDQMLSVQGYMPRGLRDPSWRGALSEARDCEAALRALGSMGCEVDRRRPIEASGEGGKPIGADAARRRGEQHLHLYAAMSRLRHDAQAAAMDLLTDLAHAYAAAGLDFDELARSAAARAGDERAPARAGDEVGAGLASTHAGSLS